MSRAVWLGGQGVREGGGRRGGRLAHGAGRHPAGEGLPPPGLHRAPPVREGKPVLGNAGVAGLRVRGSGVEGKEAAGAGVEGILDHREHLLGRRVIHVAVAVVDKDVVLEDVGAEVDRIAETTPVVLLPLLVG